MFPSSCHPCFYSVMKNDNVTPISCAHFTFYLVKIFHHNPFGLDIELKCKMEHLTAQARCFTPTD